MTVCKLLAKHSWSLTIFTGSTSPASSVISCHSTQALMHFTPKPGNSVPSVLKTSSSNLFLSMCLCAQWCMTLCDSMDCSLPGSSVLGILKTRILAWVAISFSRGSSWTRDRTHVFWISCIARWVLYHWAPWEVWYIAWGSVNICQMI